MKGKWNQLKALLTQSQQNNTTSGNSDADNCAAFVADDNMRMLMRGSSSSPPSTPLSVICATASERRRKRSRIHLDKGWQFLRFFYYFRRFFNVPDSRHFRHKLSSFFHKYFQNFTRSKTHLRPSDSGPKNSTNETKITRLSKKVRFQNCHPHFGETSKKYSEGRGSTRGATRSYA